MRQLSKPQLKHGSFFEKAIVSLGLYLSKLSQGGFCHSLLNAPSLKDISGEKAPTCIYILGANATNSCSVIGHLFCRLDILVINALSKLVHDGHTSHDALFTLGPHSHHLAVHGHGSCQPRDQGQLGDTSYRDNLHDSAGRCHSPFRSCFFNQHLLHRLFGFGFKFQISSSDFCCFRSYCCFNIFRINVIKPDFGPGKYRFNYI